MDAHKHSVGSHLAGVQTWFTADPAHVAAQLDWQRIQTLTIPGVADLGDYRKRVELGAVDAEVYLLQEGTSNPSREVILETHRQMFATATKDAGRIRVPADGNVQFGGRLGAEAQRIPIELERLEAEMADLLSQVQTDEDRCAAMAFYHARYISIHPFVDGNGRTGRAIMKGQAASMGMSFDMGVIEKNKPEYISAINHARETNDVAPLMRVVGRCTGIQPTWHGELVSDSKIYGRLMLDYGDVKSLSEEREMAKTGIAASPLPSVRGQSAQFEPFLG